MVNRLEEIITVVESQKGSIRQLSHNDLNWLIQQAHRAEKNAQDLDDMDRQLFSTQKLVERYREVFQEIKENKITCWEVIENKLNFAFYKE